MKRDPRLVRLSREHTQALMLAQEIEGSIAAASGKQVQELYSTVVAFWSAGLLTHFTAEGECLLARLIRHVPLEDERVTRLQRDHLRIEALVATMRDTGSLDVRRDALGAFAERLRAHVRWEEETLFPAVETLLEGGELDAVGRDLAARLPERPLSYRDAPPQAE